MAKTHLYLCGLRGTGKTSVAAALSKLLSLPTFDLDRIVESDSGLTIAEIFADGGELIFRDFETVGLQTVARGTQAVISLGGGAVLREKNRETIEQTGHVAWLTAPPESLVARIADDETTAESRPALTDQSPLAEMQSTLETRQPIYEALADIEVDTEGKSIEEVAEEVATWFRALNPKP